MPNRLILYALFLCAVTYTVALGALFYAFGWHQITMDLLDQFSLTLGFYHLVFPLFLAGLITSSHSFLSRWQRSVQAVLGSFLGIVASIASLILSAFIEFGREAIIRGFELAGIYYLSLFFAVSLFPLLSWLFGAAITPLTCLTVRTILSGETRESSSAND